MNEAEKQCPALVVVDAAGNPPVTLRCDKLVHGDGEKHRVVLSVRGGQKWVVSWA